MSAKRRSAAFPSPYLIDFSVETEIVRVFVFSSDQRKHYQNVLCNRRVDAPEIDRVPTAILFGVVPCK